MKTALATGFACLIGLALIASFSTELGLDLIIPGFETMKTTVVGVVFLVIAIGGLFHQINKRKPDD